MSSFVHRRAHSLAIEAERLAVLERWGEAVERLETARDLLLGERQTAPPDLPRLLRRLGDFAAQAGNDKLSDDSYLEARRLEKERKQSRSRPH